MLRQRVDPAPRLLRARQPDEQRHMEAFVVQPGAVIADGAVLAEGVAVVARHDQPGRLVEAEGVQLV